MVSSQPVKRIWVHFTFLCSTLVLLCLYSGCVSVPEEKESSVNSPTLTGEIEDKIEYIRAEAEKKFAINPYSSFTEDCFTLLERIYIDLTGDGIKDCIELYTTAQVYDGELGWDDGHYWVLFVQDGDAFYPLIRQWVQHGEVQFWAARINVKKLEAPDTKDLEARLYVMVISAGHFEILCFTWDEQSSSFTKETVLEPSNQWYDFGRLSHRKYSFLGDGYIDKNY